MRITNITPVYDADGSITDYRIAVDNDSDTRNYISANLTIKANEIDITDILRVCNEKLRETVA